MRSKLPSNRLVVVVFSLAIKILVVARQLLIVTEEPRLRSLPRPEQVADVGESASKNASRSSTVFVEWYKWLRVWLALCIFVGIRQPGTTVSNHCCYFFQSNVPITMHCNRCRQKNFSREDGFNTPISRGAWVRSFKEINFLSRNSIP